MLTLLFVISTALAADGWEATLDRVVPSVVMIRSYAPRSFDGKRSGSSYATGFVVDAEQGLILTNRHVVKPGPVVAEAIFQDNEEVELEAIYRDPVHDFGLFRFDPEAVKFMEVSALSLRPSHARVGTEIRLIGSDSGEKVSILGGTLARLDRKAPAYGVDRFNDFNTFYIQAASSSSGGSSGSPVVDIHGHVVALNAGSRRQTASSYFLPLERVVHALELIQEGKPVARGTLLTTFEHEAFDEVKRLGLQAQTESDIRLFDSDATGMLVVERVQVEGPGHELLQPGDVLIKVDGEPLTGFVPLAARLDEQVGGSVQLSIERGGEAMDVDVPVHDLHAVTPDEYLEVGGAVIHPFSYQMARHHAVPVVGMMVAEKGYLFRRGLPERAVIVTVNGEPVPSLESLEKALVAVPHRERFTVRYFMPKTAHRTRLASFYMDRQWFTMRRCHRDDQAGRWPCVDSDVAPSAPSEKEPVTASIDGAKHRLGRKLASAMVEVAFTAPYRTDGLYSGGFMGIGVVVDAERGLVICDRDTVPVALGDVTLTFARSFEVPGRVKALHPLHNLALVSYDPERLGETPVEAVEFDPKPLDEGDPVWMVGLGGQKRIQANKTEVAHVEPLQLPIPGVPFFRETNQDLVEVRDTKGTFLGGVLTDRRGAARALWGSFPDLADKDHYGWFRGIPAAVVLDFLERVEKGEPWRTLGVEWVPLPLVEARALGLDPALAQDLETHDPGRRVVLSATRVTLGTPASERIETGDMLIGIGGDAVTRFPELEEASQAETVPLSLVRNGEVVQVDVPTVPMENDTLDRVVLWAGALLQKPHAAVAQQRGQTRNGVYVGFYWYGSPAGRYGLRPLRRIMAVDGAPVEDLDGFMEAVKEKGHGDPVRLRTIDLQGREHALTLKLDSEFWPTRELRRVDGAWVTP